LKLAALMRVRSEARRRRGVKLNFTLDDSKLAAGGTDAAYRDQKAFL
jgi:hypothetical protein